jgi:hypothetical protein
MRLQPGVVGLLVAAAAMATIMCLDTSLLALLAPSSPVPLAAATIQHGVDTDGGNAPGLVHGLAWSSNSDRVSDAAEAASMSVSPVPLPSAAAPPAGRLSPSSQSWSMQPPSGTVADAGTSVDSDTKRQRPPVERTKRRSSVPPLSSCKSLAPTHGAVLFWPNKHRAGTLAHPQPAWAPASPLNLSDVWSISLCAAPAPASPRVASATCVDCEGVLRLVRAVGCNPDIDKSRMAYDDAAIAAVAEALGPDDISVWLEGAELIAPLGRHVGDCTYDFTFRATIPGVYRVVAVVTRSDWDSLDEVEKSYPPSKSHTQSHTPTYTHTHTAVT